MSKRLLLVAVAVAGIASSACSRQPQQPAAQQVHTSRALEYSSLKHAAREADAVVEIAVDAQGAVERVGAVPFTVTEARVTEVLKGEHAAGTIRLRQLGSTQGAGLVPEGELLQAGKRYIAIVVPFTFGDYQPTGQHVVVGGWQGLYRVEGDEVVATDVARTSLPRRLTRQNFVAAVTS